MSRRQQEILLQLVHGVHMKEIAANFGCAYSSVRTHVQRMGRKLGCVGTKELILKVFLDALGDGR